MNYHNLRIADCIHPCEFKMKAFITSSIVFGAAVQAATSGKLTALSFNVAGLPSILQSNDVEGDKTDNAGQLGKYFAEYGYDIINMQEVSANSRLIPCRGYANQTG